MATAKCIYVAIVGVGGVGAAFLTQLADLSERLSGSKIRPVDICVVYIGRSKTCLLADPDNPIFLDGRHGQSDLAGSGRTPLSFEELADFLAKLPGPSVLVDNTSSQKPAEAYHLFLRSRTHVVTPNKKGFSSSLALWNSIFDVAANYGNTVPRAGSLFFGPAVSPSFLAIMCPSSKLSAAIVVLSICLRDLRKIGLGVRRCEEGGRREIITR